MSFEYDLSLIVCPKCHENNDNLEVTGLHVFTSDEGDRPSYYDIWCYNCREIFTKRTPLCLKQMS